MRILAVVASLLVLSSAVWAAQYRLPVTRDERDQYRSPRGVLILTRHCIVVVVHEDAVLRWDGKRGQIHFLEQNDSCAVERVLAEVDPKPDRYAIKVSWENDDWYRTQRDGLFIATRSCKVHSQQVDAVLDLVGETGEIYFVEDQVACDVEAVWSEVK